MKIRHIIPWLIKKRYERAFKNKNLRIGIYSHVTNTEISNNVFIGNETSLNRCTIGDNSYVGSNSKIKNCQIGKFCSIAGNVTIGLGLHPTNLISTHPAFYSKNKGFITFADKDYFIENLDVKIGNDVWIGYNSIIMDGVEIADGAIIAGGSFVSKNVKPYEVVGGVPAKNIKFRFDDDKIAKLLEIKWWDRDINWLKEHFSDFLNVESFFDKYSGRQ